MKTIARIPAAAACVAVLTVASGILRGEEAAESPFAPALLETASGSLLDADGLYAAEDCGACHTRQHEDWKGSMHSRAHHDSIYLAFAERAREEGGDALYRFCSGCHAAAAVATGEIPGDGKTKPASWRIDEGVTCDVCHTADRVREVHAGGGANASLRLVAGETRFGPLPDAADNLVHSSGHSPLHREARFCSACHTLIHPHNGVVIENTYEEWAESAYAEAGIGCRDCHMRTVEESIVVARTMKPVRTPGLAADDMEERPDVKRHLFVGANVNATLTGGSEEHAAMAAARLRSAITVELEVPDDAQPGAKLPVTVAVTNVGAGHSIPTSITELRQVWIDLKVTDAAGREVFRSGAVDPESGAVDPGAVMYTSVLVDEQGEVTYLPWRAAKMVKHEALDAKQTRREAYAVELPADARGPFAVRAVVRYRSAPQEVMDDLFGKGRYPIRIVDMAEVETSVGS